VEWSGRASFKGRVFSCQLSGVLKPFREPKSEAQFRVAATSKSPLRILILPLIQFRIRFDASLLGGQVDETTVVLARLVINDPKQIGELEDFGGDLSRFRPISQLTRSVIRA
jgi:hypothetical protein